MCTYLSNHSILVAFHAKFALIWWLKNSNSEPSEIRIFRLGSKLGNAPRWLDDFPSLFKSRRKIIKKKLLEIIQKKIYQINFSKTVHWSSLLMFFHPICHSVDIVRTSFETSRKLARYNKDIVYSPSQLEAGLYELCGKFGPARVCAKINHRCIIIWRICRIEHLNNSSARYRNRSYFFDILNNFLLFYKYLIFIDCLQ